MSSIRTTLHHYVSSQLFIRTIHLSPNTVGFQPLIWSPDNQFSYQPGRLIFRPAPPAAKLQNRPLYGSEEGQRLQIFRRWTTTWNSFQLVKRRKQLKQKFHGTDSRSSHHPGAKIRCATRIPLCRYREQDTGFWKVGSATIQWILVDSGSSVTAMSDIFYRNLVYAGAPLGTLQVTARTLRSANGTSIEVLGCSRCSVSFLGLRTEFPIIICSLTTGTDAIIGTDVLGSVLPHTLDIKNGLLFAQGGASLQLHRKDSALSGRVFTVGHSSIPPYSEAVLHCSVRTTGGRALPSSGLLEGLTLFAEDTGLIVGRTLVDPSGWKVPVLVSNFSQETVVVNPFTSDRHTVCGGRRDTTSGGGRRATLSSTRFG